MMRKMMLAATFGLAACGTVESASDDGIGDDGSGSQDDGSGSGSDGSGSGAGSGSGGMDGGMPVACTTAADCGMGRACDVATHECVTGVLTIQPTQDFVVDNNRWWTATSNPIVRGTFYGATASVVQVVVNGNGTLAALQGNTWTVQLPVGSIAPQDTWIKVMMTDPSGGLVELMQLMNLDNAAPAITLQPSKLRDERGDTVDFSSGEPVHVHAGAEIDLAGAPCPAVYKYGYLMDASAPQYGSAATPNPLAWKLTIADTKLDPTSKAFRVRTDANQTMINWTPMPAPDAVGVHRIELTRSGGAYPIAALGTRSGRFYIDVRARDWNGLEANASYCFDHHPLAAPVAVQPLHGAELFSMSFAGDSAFSKFLNLDGSRGDVITQTIVQHVAEPVTIEWSATGGALQYSKTFLYDYVIDYIFQPINCPTGTTDSRCRVFTDPAHTAPTTETGSVTPAYKVVVRDGVTGDVIHASTNAQIVFQLPGRGTSEAAHPYVITLTSGGWADIRPPDLFTYLGETVGEFTLLGKKFTGVAPFASPGVSCSQILNTGYGPQCLYLEQHYRISALDRVTLSVAPFTATVKTGANSSALSAAPYIAATALTSGTLAWDSGDDDLPGTY